MNLSWLLKSHFFWIIMSHVFNIINFEILAQDYIQDYICSSSLQFYKRYLQPHFENYIFPPISICFIAVLRFKSKAYYQNHHKNRRILLLFSVIIIHNQTQVAGLSQEAPYLYHFDCSQHFRWAMGHLGS